MLHSAMVKWAFARYLHSLGSTSSPCCRKDPAKAVSLDNVESIFRFSDSQDEEGFRMVYVVAEAAAAPAMTALLSGLVRIASM